MNGRILGGRAICVRFRRPVVPSTRAQSERPKNRIAWLRKAQKLKREELAARVGVDEAMLKSWESGGVQVPDRYALELADVFGVTPVWLLGLEEPMPWRDGKRGR